MCIQTTITTVTQLELKQIEERTEKKIGSKATSLESMLYSWGERASERERKETVPCEYNGTRKMHKWSFLQRK